LAEENMQACSARFCHIYHSRGYVYLQWRYQPVLCKILMLMVEGTGRKGPCAAYMHMALLCR